MQVQAVLRQLCDGGGGGLQVVVALHDLLRPIRDAHVAHQFLGVVRVARQAQELVSLETSAIRRLTVKAAPSPSRDWPWAGDSWMEGWSIQCCLCDVFSPANTWALRTEYTCSESLGAINTRKGGFRGAKISVTSWLISSLVRAEQQSSLAGVIAVKVPPLDSTVS